MHTASWSNSGLTVTDESGIEIGPVEAEGYVCDFEAKHKIGNGRLGDLTNDLRRATSECLSKDLM